jgi:hypothetical protein
MVAVNQIEIKTVPQLPPLQSPFDDGDLMIVWRGGRLWGGTAGQITENAINDLNDELAAMLYDLSGAVTSADDILPSDSEAGPETDDAFVVASAREPLPPLPNQFAIAVRFHRANTGPTWLRVEGAGESAKVYKGGMELLAGDLEAGGIQTCVWNESGGNWDVFRTSVSAVAEHTHPMDDISGLDDEITSLYASITTVDNKIAPLQSQVTGLTTSKQNTNVNLTALSGLAGLADRIGYFTGVGAMALTAFTSVGRTFVGLTTTALQFDAIKQSATETYAGSIELADTTEALAKALNTRAITPLNLASFVASASLVGMTRFATNAETIAGSLATVAVTPAGLAAAAPTTPPAASDTVAGLIELATDAEAIAKSLATRAITPSNLAALGASATAIGMTRFATTVEAAAGTLTTAAVTPAGVEAHLDDRQLMGSGVLDFPSIAVGASADLTIAVTNSSVYDGVTFGYNGGNALAEMSAFVNPAGTVVVRCRNHSGVAIDMGPLTFRAYVFKV